MVEVYISIGSNVLAEQHIRAAVQMLREQFGELQLSSTYKNPAVGFEGEDFLNLVALFHSDKSAEEIIGILREIEARNGRDRSQAKFSARTLDVDLLLYGDSVVDKPGLRLPRDEISRYAFVLGPLAELAGAQQHPVTKQTYEDMWQVFTGDKQLQPFDIAL